MKLGIVLCCLLLGSSFSHAQVLMGTAGGHQTSLTTQLQWSMGESIIGNYSSTVNSFSIGYQQPIKIEIVGLEDKEIFSGIRLYPNPFMEYVYVELPEKIISDYQLIINMPNGKILRVELEADDEHGRIKIDATKWASGIYLLSIMHNQKLFVAKLIKP